MFDTHTHSTYSPDGKKPLSLMADAALQRGLQGIACTEHAEWYPGDDAYGYLSLPDYFANLHSLQEAYADKLTVLSGIELGNPHDFPTEVTNILTSWSFDFVIGSVHWMDNLAGWERPIFQRGIANTYRRYFDEVLTMVDQAQFDVLGHLDLVRRDSWALFQQVLPLSDYSDIIHQILKRLIERGKGLEVNTSGLRKGMSETLPNLEVLSWYRNLGGKILVFGSDAHQSADIAYGFDMACEVAKAAGFSEIVVYKQRQITRWIRI
ncbi:MAG: histidinol-phosphatase HisJ family protein [Anaerolineales bacterium]|nr:MAG: histidinol-phosphatase HisJ family protein [Anaerolineales bacterium]